MVRLTNTVKFFFDRFVIFFERSQCSLYFTMNTNDLNSNLIYLDYNATTPLAEEVLEGIKDSLVNDWGNPSSYHPFGAKAKAAVNKARRQIADMLSCSPSEVTFTSGGTEANNMVIFSAVRDFQNFRRQGSGTKFGEKPHIITTNVEHDSIILPIRYLEEHSMITYTAVKVANTGCVRIDDILSAITDQTCLITVMYANNETGVIMPIPELGKKLLKINAERQKRQLKEILFHTDAAQIIGKEPLNFESLNVNYMTVVGHKFYGPRIGCLVANKVIHPTFFGGGQEDRIRPGTENTPMIVGLGIAAKLVADNCKSYREHMIECRRRLESRLLEAFGDEISINCEESERLPNTSNVAFKGGGFEGTLVLSRCKNLIASVGAACHPNQCSQILINSGVPEALARNSIRLSLGRETTFQDIEDVVADLWNAVKKLKANSNF